MTEKKFTPLATRMRPQTLEKFVGQSHLTAKGKPLYQAAQEKHLHSMIFWGPPGTGKTTLATILAARVDARVEQLSAVLAGVKDIRDVVARAQLERDMTDKSTVLFVDEVHRFNKAQQDAFLPHVENGTIILIGATTENPSFELNNALLSRVRVYVLKALNAADLHLILENALHDTEFGLGERHLVLSEEVKKQIVHYSDGDARQCLNALEILADFAIKQGDHETIPEGILEELMAGGVRRFDKQGDAFYDQISALHKAVRGSDPDAALYWFSRMVDGGSDPVYIARRLVRMASEDIGNADPRGLQLALNAWDVYDRLGSPEGELALAQAVVYLACAPKSNALYKAYGFAMQDAKQWGSQEVPIYLRHVPTGYRYAHDEPNAFAKGVHYFPENIAQRYYYSPVSRGLEIQIKEKLEKLRE